MKQEEVIARQLQKLAEPLAKKLSEAVDFLVPAQMSKEDKAVAMDALLEQYMPAVIEKINSVNVRELIKSARDAVNKDVKEKVNGND